MKPLMICIAVMLSLALPPKAQAAVIQFGPISTTQPGANITFDGLAVPTTIEGDATLTFSVLGDLNAWYEFVQVWIDDLFLGTALDNTPGNDVFDFPNGDRGSQSRALHTGTATLSNAQLAPLIADGEVNLRFDFSPFVDCCGGIGQLSGALSFQEGSLAPVPIPAPLGMLGAGLIALGLWSRRRASKAAAAQTALS